MRESFDAVKEENHLPKKSSECGGQEKLLLLMKMGDILMILLMQTLAWCSVFDGKNRENVLVFVFEFNHICSCICNGDDNNNG